MVAAFAASATQWNRSRDVRASRLFPLLTSTSRLGGFGMTRIAKLGGVALVVLFVGATLVSQAQARPNYCKAFIAQYESVKEAKDAKCSHLPSGQREEGTQQLRRSSGQDPRRREREGRNEDQGIADQDRGREERRGRQDLRRAAERRQVTGQQVSRARTGREAFSQDGQSRPSCVQVPRGTGWYATDPGNAAGRTEMRRTSESASLA